MTVPTGAYLSDIDIEVINGDINVRDLTCKSASLSAISGTITADEVVAWEPEMESDFGTLSGINLSVASRMQKLRPATSIRTALLTP